MAQVQKIPLAEAVAIFLSDVEARRLSPRTHEHYRTRLSAFVAWLTPRGVTILHDITPTELRAYLSHQAARGLASATQHTVYRSLRAFLNFTVAEGWLDRSPLARIKPPKVEKKLPRVLSPEQVRALVKAAPTEREHALLLLILDTGLRVSEVCALNGGDVSMATGAVHVRHGKGGKDRLTFCGAKTRRQLYRYFAERGRPGDDEPLFVSERGGQRLTRSGLDRAFRQVAKLANVPGATPHTLRRTYATNMLRAGCDLHTLARLMGHEDLSTLRAYVRLLDTDLKAASQRFGVVDNLL